ncbi:MAG: TasA family protein [Pseudoflavonifractor sp.]
MNKKKIGLIVTAVALVSAIAVGGTLAWFTNTKTATNTATMGSIEITMDETVNKPNDQAIVTETKTENAKTGYEFKNIMPGDTITKTLAIKNTGSNDAYLRVKITLAGLTKDEVAAGAKMVALEGWTLDTASVTEGTSEVLYATYAPKFAPAAEQAPVFNFSVPTAWTAATAQPITITVEAQAVQSANFNPATGWEGLTF